MTPLTETPALAGMRILIVEDDMMLALSLEMLLEPLGCAMVKAAQLNRALEQAETHPLGGALLDINLGGEDVYPVAKRLAAREVPFIFLTGYHPRHVKTQWRDYPVLEKPFAAEELEKLVIRTFIGGPPPSTADRPLL